MLFFCEIIILLLIYYEYKAFHTVTTPVVILGGIYLIFMPLINIVGVELGFIPLTDKTIFFFTFFLCLVFLSGLFFSLLYNRFSISKIDSVVIENKLLKSKKNLWTIYLVSLLAYVINLLQVINRYGIDNTKSKAYGPLAHIGFFSRCLLPIILYYFIKERKNKYLFAAIINIIALILFKGKYHLYIAIGGFVIIFLLTKKNINIVKTIKVAILTFIAAALLFISVYTIIPNIVAGDMSYKNMINGLKFSIKHFFHYLFCPFIDSNEFFNNPIYLGMESGIRTVLNPFDRLYQWIIGTGDYFDPVISLWPVVDKSGTTANVGGLFSESVLNIGYFSSFIYVFVISLIVYYFMSKTLYKGKRILTSVYLVGMLMLCFFCNFFSLLPNFECFVYCYMMDVFILDVKFTFGNRRLFRR